MSTKEAAIEMIRELPDEASIEDIMAEVLFLSKIERGSKQLDAGEGVDHAEVEKRFQKCHA